MLSFSYPDKTCIISEKDLVSPDFKLVSGQPTSLHVFLLSMVRRSRIYVQRKVVTYQRVPGACAKTGSVIAHAQTADPVLVTNERSNLLTPRNIPDLLDSVSIRHARGGTICALHMLWNAYLALKVIVTSKQKSPRYRGSDRSDAAEDGFRLRIALA
jgi:hypothetical protein